MPTPAGAGMVVAAVWFKVFLVGPEMGLGLPPLVPAIGVMSLGLLMVSPIPYHSFKNVRFGRSYSATVIPVIISIILILEPGLNFFLVGLVYVISGPAGYVWRWRTGRELLPAEDTGPPGSSEAGTGNASADEPNVTNLADHVQAGDPRGGEKGR